MIHIYKLIILYIVYAKIRQVSMITLRNKQTILTLHSYEKSWNEAQALCESENSGNLYNVDSAEKHIVLETYKANWNVVTDLWIGLHYPDILIDVTTSFGWTNCLFQEVGYDAFQAGEPKNLKSKKCVMSDPTDGSWATGNCPHQIHFVCETVNSTPCSFDSYTGTPESTVNSTTTTASDVTACQQDCLSTVHTMNCWAIMFEPSTSSCTLYYLDDPFYLTTSLTATPQTTYIKNCYSSNVDTVSSATTTSGSSSPTQVCAVYSNTTLTSTTSSSTTSTSTTSSSSTAAPTTSSSSTAATTSSAASTTSQSTSSSTTSQTASSSLTTSSTAPTTSQSTSSTPTSQATSSATSTASPSSTSLSNSQTTTSSPPSTTTTTSCKCGCNDILSNVGNFTKSPEWYNLTTEQKVDAIVQKLSVDKTKLSSTSRKKSSAQDDRAASKSVGFVAIIFMSLLFGLLVLSDLINFFKFISKWRQESKVNEVMHTEPVAS